MTIQESLDKVIQTLPDRPIYQILITKLVPDMFIADYDKRKYILINHIQWIRLEQELDFLLERKPTEQIIPNNMFMTYYGIPVYENEQLVKEILQHVLSEIGFFNRENFSKKEQNST